MRRQPLRNETSRKGLVVCATGFHRNSVPHGAVVGGEDCLLDVDGVKIAYDYVKGANPTIVFLSGFYDARWRMAKSNAIKIFAERQRQGFLVMDYRGIGRSEGDFVKCCLSDWIADTLRIIDEVIDGPVVLVGAGIGGWIGLHVARLRPKFVCGLVGINADPDFTEDLLLPSLTEEQKKIIEDTGVLDLPWGYRSYPISKKLIDDARERWLIMNKGPGSVDVNCPVRLIQGMADEEIPPERALKVISLVKSDDASCTFVKNGDHTLENDDDFRRIWEAVSDVSSKFFEYDLSTSAV